jgi:cytochrome c biogenesis protein CcmG/thiol:disulfide interchange protein DsbE
VAADTFYTLLGVSTEATPKQITTAYERKRERYSAERVVALGDEFERVAATRTAEIEHAYQVLVNPERRRVYDRSIGIGTTDTPEAVQSRMLSRREWTMVLAGGLSGLLVIAIVWVLAARGAQPGLPAVAETNRPAPEFALPGLNGETIRLSDYRGKVVLVNFWGTWCQPCKEETPALQAVYSKLRDQGLVIVGVDLRNQERAGAEGDANVRGFVNQYGVTYPIALDVNGDIARAYQIYPIPTSFFVDRSGAIRYMSVSKVTAEEVETLFARLNQETTL